MNEQVKKFCLGQKYILDGHEMVIPYELVIRNLMDEIGCNARCDESCKVL